MLNVHTGDYKWHFNCFYENECQWMSTDWCYWIIEVPGSNASENYEIGWWQLKETKKKLPNFFSHQSTSVWLLTIEEKVEETVIKQ